MEKIVNQSFSYDITFEAKNAFSQNSKSKLFWSTSSTKVDIGHGPSKHKAIIINNTITKSRFQNCQENVKTDKVT